MLMAQRKATINTLPTDSGAPRTDKFPCVLSSVRGILSEPAHTDIVRIIPTLSRESGPGKARSELICRSIQASRPPGARRRSVLRSNEQEWSA